MLYIMMFFGLIAYVVISSITALFLPEGKQLPIGRSIVKDIKNKDFKTLIKRGFTYFWIGSFLMIVLVPVIWMVSASFSPVSDLEYVPISPDLSRWSLTNYMRIFTEKSSTGQVLSDYWSAFLLTLVIAIFTTVLTVVLSTLAGLALSRYKYKGKKKILLTMMGLQMFPAMMSMMAMLFLFMLFGLYGKPMALILVYSIGAVPYNSFIIRGYLRNVPRSLDEAASIDGATNLQILTKILFPLTLPIIGFISVTSFMTPWMDYIFAEEMLGDEIDTVATFLFPLNDVISAEYDPMLFFAGAIFVAVPILVVQIYMQKYVIGGLMAGADKG